jgi:sterol desaturase/sphingolipid hydroxylase (fatty acid hydroxylase superfamily)
MTSDSSPPGSATGVLGHLLQRLADYYVAGGPALLRSLAVALAVAAVVLLAELAFVPWQSSSLRRLARLSPTARTDLLAFLLVETNVGLFLGMAMFLGLTYGAQKSLRLWPESWQLHLANPWLAVPLFFVLTDFANYWVHRWCHTLPLLWRFHRYHHSAPEMTVFTATRDHPLERAFSGVVVAAATVWIGLPPTDIMVLHLSGKAIGLAKHSNVHANWGWFGRWVIQSPAAHRIHHSSAPEHHNVNYASLFQWWDVWFGSAVHPTAEQSRAVAMGVEDDTGHRPPLRYLLEIYADFLRHLGQAVRGRLTSPH